MRTIPDRRSDSGRGVRQKAGDGDACQGRSRKGEREGQVGRAVDRNVMEIKKQRDRQGVARGRDRHRYQGEKTVSELEGTLKLTWP